MITQIPIYFFFLSLFFVLFLSVVRACDYPEDFPLFEMYYRYVNLWSFVITTKQILIPNYFFEQSINV